MKKNLFNFDKNNSFNANGSLVSQLTCEPCALECEKIKTIINNRELSEIKDEEVAHILSPFKF